MADEKKKKDEKKKSAVPPPMMYGSELERARDLQAGTALDTADFDTKFKHADVKKRKQMMAKGGKVRKSCDGIAKRGKTKGRMR